MKKYALNNSYFKNIGYTELPKTPLEVVKYYKEKGELPYRGEPTEDRIYEMFIEYQKRQGVIRDQFFTPPELADAFVHKCKFHGDRNGNICEIGSGTGIITKRMLKQQEELNDNSNIDCFEIDEELIEICELQGIKANYKQEDFIESSINQKYSIVYGNPPYTKLQEILEKIEQILLTMGYAFLIIPLGYLDKTRPKKLVEILDKFSIIDRIKPNIEFARTKIKTEIVVLQKIT